jgi:hypothetical protein
VHQRPAQGHACPRPKYRVARGVGVGVCDRPAQTLQPRIQHAGSDRRLAGLQLCQSARPPLGRTADSSQWGGAQRVGQGRSRRHSQFTLEEFPARGRLARRTDTIASVQQAAHQLDLGTLVQRVQCQEAPSKFNGLGSHSARQSSQGSKPEHIHVDGRIPAALQDDRLAPQARRAQSTA